MIRHLPGAIGAGRNVPHAFFDQVIQATGNEHRRTGIADIHQIGAIDGLIDGFTVILDIDIHNAPLHGGRLRDLGIQYRILRFFRAGDVDT